MKIAFIKLRQILEADYKSKHTINAILGGHSKPNADLRYKYEKEHGIPFNGWGKEIKKYIEEACPCCGTVLKEPLDVDELKRLLRELESE